MEFTEVIKRTCNFRVIAFGVITLCVKKFITVYVKKSYYILRVTNFITFWVNLITFFGIITFCGVFLLHFVLALRYAALQGLKTQKKSPFARHIPYDAQMGVSPDLEHFQNSKVLL